MSDPGRISRRSPVEQCPVVQTNVHWPAPIDQRLNELLDVLSTVAIGEISRSRLLAALVALAPSDGDELARTVRMYREMTAGSVVLQQRGDIVVGPRQPGRRRQ